MPPASYLAYRGAAALAQALPLATGERIASATGRALSYAMPGRRRLVARNLGRATAGSPGGPLEGADLARAVRETFASYGRYWLELFRLPEDVRRAESFEARFESVGFGHITEGLAAGRGVILALPHLGGFDFAAAWLAGRGAPPVVVVEAVEPPELFAWFVEVREAIGMDVIPLGRDAGGAVLRALRGNRAVCLLCDRDLSGDGVAVDFFGEATTLPAGPATLALRTGAPLVPVGVFFRPRGRHFARIGPPIPVEREGRLREDVARITQVLAHRFEELIRESPTDWHLMQPNWASDYEPARPS